MYYEEIEETQEVLISKDRLIGILDGSVAPNDIKIWELNFLKEGIQEIIKNRIYH